MAVEVGDKAPAFTLPATGPREAVSLSDFAGQNVVLLFYPFDWSSVCTAELCGINDELKSFEQLGAQVLAVSADSMHSHRAWAQAKQISYPLLSDWNKTVCQAYDSLYDEFRGLKGVPKRSAFVIDGQGVVRYKYISPDLGTIPPVAEIKKALEGLA